MCNCIKEAEQSIKDEMGAADARWEHFGSSSSEVSYTPYTKTGRKAKHRRSTEVPWRFCPLCGEEYTERTERP